MSLNKFMHPRNPYRNPPDFKELALKYPQFMEYVKQTITGKTIIDFKDQDAVRTLSTCLLHRDFQLSVEMPPGRLIPTLPLRLNYLLWIEDLLRLLAAGKNENVTGVDIGTGSSCIYPLLGSRTFGWKFIATEADQENYEYSIKNVQKNQLESFVNVTKASSDRLFSTVDSQENIAFTMCNPPFYGLERSKSRQGRPSPPHNFGGEAMEISADGGEVEFVSKMVEESKRLGHKIIIFSTMLGHKSSLKPIKRLVEASGASHLITTEFCQGRTMRWGIAWTFQDVPLEACPVLKRDKPKAPVTWVVPQNYFKDKWYNVKSVDRRILDILNQLNMTIEPIRSTKYHVTYTVTANENTWVHQRRRRREEQRLKKLQEAVVNLVSDKESVAHATDAVGEDVLMDTDRALTSVLPDQSGIAAHPTNHKAPVSADQSVSVAQKRALDREEENEELGSKRLKADDSFDYSDDLEPEPTHLARFKLTIQKTGPCIGLSMKWVDGTGGTEVLHQILVYLKNQLASTKPSKADS